MDGLPADPMTWLRGQLRKARVGLGGLPWAQQRLALAWVWAGLPAGESWDERALNALLLQQLSAPEIEPPQPGQGAAAWLRGDHVELRRWLVDAGLLLRDGYGRRYRAAQAQALPAAWEAPLQQAARAFAALDTAATAAAERAVHRAERAQRQAVWAQSGQQGGQGL